MYLQGSTKSEQSTLRRSARVQLQRAAAARARMVVSPLECNPLQYGYAFRLDEVHQDMVTQDQQHARGSPDFDTMIG
jgi:hypothetical protein